MAGLIGFGKPTDCIMLLYITGGFLNYVIYMNWCNFKSLIQIIQSN